LPHHLVISSGRDDDHDWRTALVLNPGALQFAPEALRNDREVVLAAVSASGWVLFFASPTLRADRDVVRYKN
jgi:hypothetical protein